MRELDKRYEEDNTMWFIKVSSLNNIIETSLIWRLTHCISEQLARYKNGNANIQCSVDLKVRTAENATISDCRSLIHNLINRADELDEHYESAENLFSAISDCVRLLPGYYYIVKDPTTKSQINLTLMLLGHTPIGKYDSSYISKDVEAIYELIDGSHNFCWYNDIPDDVGREICRTLNAAKDMIYSGNYLPYFAQLNKLRKMKGNIGGARKLVYVLDFLYTYFYAK